MKGKISIAGSLYIERNGILKPVFCPFRTEGGCNKDKFVKENIIVVSNKKPKES